MKLPGQGIVLHSFSVMTDFWQTSTFRFCHVALHTDLIVLLPPPQATEHLVISVHPILAKKLKEK